jgi:hypothetical protein
MIRAMPTVPLGPDRLELQGKRLSGRLPQIRVRRAHLGGSASSSRFRAKRAINSLRYCQGASMEVCDSRAQDEEPYLK